MGKDKTNIEATQTKLEALAQEFFEHAVLEFDWSHPGVNPAEKVMVRLRDTIKNVSAFAQAMEARGIDTEELVPVTTPDPFPGWDPADIALHFSYMDEGDPEGWIHELKEEKLWW